MCVCVSLVALKCCISVCCIAKWNQLYVYMDLLCFGFPYSPRDPQESSPASQFEIISSSVLSFLYGPTHSVHDYWKNHSFDIQTFVGKVMSLLFNMLSRSRDKGRVTMKTCRWQKNCKYINGPEYRAKNKSTHIISWILTKKVSPM